METTYITQLCVMEVVGPIKCVLLLAPVPVCKDGLDLLV